MVRVIAPLRGVSELAAVDEAEITRRYGIPGTAYGDYALLRGDPSDGLPGVKGIGEKTAQRLIEKYGSLDALLAAPDLPSSVVGKINASREYLDAARRVVLPVTDAPVPDVCVDLPTEVHDPATLSEVAERFAFDGVIGRLLQSLGLG